MLTTRWSKVAHRWTVLAAFALLTGCLEGNPQQSISEDTPDTPLRRSAAVLPTAGVVALPYGLIPLQQAEPESTPEQPSSRRSTDFSDVRPRGGAASRGATSYGPWPRGIIPLRYSPGISPAQRQRVMRACQAWQATGVITCTEHSTENYWLDIMSREADCYSSGGYSPPWRGAPQQRYTDNYINIGLAICWGTDAILIHEFGHSVGLSHEHQRPDRDRYITVQLGNVDPDDRDNFAIRTDAQTETAYDFQSIMHYPYCRRAREPGLTTIVANSGYENEGGGNATCWHPDQGGPFGGYGLRGQTVAPTADDLEAVRRMYEREPEPARPMCSTISFDWPASSDASRAWHFEWRDRSEFALCDYVPGYFGYRANVESCSPDKPTVAYNGTEIRIYNADSSLRGRARPEGGRWTPWQDAVDDASWSRRNGVWIWTVPMGASGRWDFEWEAIGGVFNWTTATSLCGYAPGSRSARSANLATCTSPAQVTVSPPRVNVHADKLTLNATLATEGRLRTSDQGGWDEGWLPLSDTGGWYCDE